MGTLKINTVNWGEFFIGDIFDTSNTGNILAREVVDGSGSTPFVTASGVNNGVAAYVDAGNFDKIKGNCILIGGKTFTLTYQNADFISNDSHNIVIRFKNKKLSRYHYMYVLSVIRASLATKYMWSDAVTKAKLLVEKIPLPICSNGDINYNYMETYMKEIEDKAISRIGQILLRPSKMLINISSFEYFHLYDSQLFTIDNGTKLDKVKMRAFKPSVNFVGRSSANNGVTDYIDEIKGLPPYPTGYMTLSLGGEYLGSCFIQNHPFYTSQNVVVLIPNHEMSFYVKQYIATVIFREGRLHYKAFVDELNRHIKRDFSIPLPVSEPGIPNWAFMESYMRRIESQVNKHLNKIL